ncbi:MAG TPA: hypothetical protein VNG71_21150 [Pyrinomonadaceae bacterium]|nr:hypothetical protein [Pyrinomonadaceae bacterium]
MSSTPPNQPFIPPPPSIGSGMYPPDMLAQQANVIASEAKTALLLSILGVFCFGFIFGFIAFRKANSGLQMIETYNVAHDKRGMLMTAKVLAIIDIVLWGIGLVLRVVLR